MGISNKKNAVVTGAASGLGRALAQELWNRNYSLALVDIDYQGLISLRNGLSENTDQQILLYKVDLANAEEIKICCEDILKQFIDIDVLFNNAGISISIPFDDLDIKDYKKLIDINFWGTVITTKYLLSGLKKSSKARIANVISDFALMGFPGKTTYGASKSAIMGFSYALRTELYESNIKVSVIIPPAMNTNLVKKGISTNEQKRQNEMLFLQKNAYPLGLAASKIINKVQQGKFRIVIGKMMWMIDTVSRLFPTMLHYLISTRRESKDFA